MSSSSTYAAVERRVDAHYDRAWRLPALLLLLLFVPLAPPLVAIVAGVAIAAIVAVDLVQARRIGHAERRVDRNTLYEPRPLPDARIRDYSLIGYGMPLQTYQERMSEWMREHGVRERSADTEAQFVASQLDQMKPIYRDDDLATRHDALLGNTGTGKTEAILGHVENSVARGGGAFIFNGKGDLNFIERVADIARHYGRLGDVRVVSFEHPHISHTYNPLMGGGHLRSLVSTVMKINAETKEEFFRDQNRAALIAAVACLHAQPNRPGFHFGDLGVLFTDPYQFHRLYQQIPEDQVHVRSFVWQFLKGFVTRDRQSGKAIYNLDRYQTLLQGLRTKMFDFAHSEYADLVCTYESDISIPRAIANNEIVIISLPSLLDKEALVTFGRLVIADIARSIGEIQSSGKLPHIPFPVIFEEYGSYKDDSHQELWQLARSANIDLILSIQGRGFLDDESTVFGDNLLTNSWHQLFFQSRDPNTIEYAQNIASSIVRQFAQSSEGEGFSYSHLSTTSGVQRQENTTASRSSGMREMRETLIQPDDLAYLNRGDALMVGVGGVYRMRMPILDFPEAPRPLERHDLAAVQRVRSGGLNLMRHAFTSDRSLIEELNNNVQQGR